MRGTSLLAISAPGFSPLIHAAGRKEYGAAERVVAAAMERESTKHGPQLDDELKHESEGMVRGVPQRPHIEEWREVEPTGNIPVPGRQLPGDDQAAADIRLRSELARVLSRSDFPASRDTLLGRLSDTDVPAELMASLNGTLISSWGLKAAFWARKNGTDTARSNNIMTTS